MSKKKRHFLEEYKKQAVELSNVGNKTVEECAKELGIGLSTLNR